MKRLILVCMVLMVSGARAQDTIKAAFLGNSYTNYNSLPVLIDSLANADGNDLVHDQNTPGGYTLNGHSTNAVSLSLIASDSWDYVVLQDQSQMPSFPYNQVITDVYPKAKILCDSIRSANACAIPVFFNTWGRLNGDPQWDSINTFEKMNNRLYLAYNHMANTNDGIVSPVGLAFKAIYDDNSAVVSHGDLYTGDGSHPSIYGSYLAACIFYNTLFSTNSQGNAYLPAGITLVEGDYLQQIASNVMYMGTSPILDYTYPIALFDFSVTGMQVTFNNMSQHAYDYTWHFGDNTSATHENPVHQYAQSGTYIVELIAAYCNRTVTYQQTVEISPLAVPEIGVDFLIYPNPAVNSIVIKAKDIRTIELINLEGKVVLYDNKPNPIHILDISNQPSGIYFLRAKTGDSVKVKKVIKK